MTGVGTRVTVYEAGRINEPGALIGLQEIGVGVGYGAGRQPVAHFGLGAVAIVDVVIETPDGTSELHRVAADEHLRWPNGC
jgi:hypothetical protein